VVLVVSLLALLPLITLVQGALFNGGGQPLGLGWDGPSQVLGTLQLVLGEGVVGALLGTSIGWLTATCRFRGRRWFRIAQLVPMAFPAYLLAASLVDWGSYRGIQIHGLGWAVALLSLANYSYVFLLSTESFSMSGSRLLEASRCLGVGPWASFFRIALPIALPSIGAGVALSAMEVVNELGAVRLLGVPSLSAGILDRWQVDGDPQGAALLALVALVREHPPPAWLLLLPAYAFPYDTALSAAARRRLPLARQLLRRWLAASPPWGPPIGRPGSLHLLSTSGRQGGLAPRLR